MRNYTYSLLFIVIAFAGCSKVTVDTPTSLVSNRSTISTTTGATSTTVVTPAVALSFELYNQGVKVNLSNKTLTMNYYENITLVARKDSLQTSWSIIFTEDFKLTQLNNFNYTTTSKTGAVTTNYAEPNLNNITISSTRDSTVNGVACTKISFNRNFLFSSTYTTSTAAGAEYDYLLNNRETIGFSAFITSASGKSKAYSSTATVVYSSY